MGYKYKKIQSVRNYCNRRISILYPVHRYHKEHVLFEKYNKTATNDEKPTS